jgi:hypothetical protein
MAELDSALAIALAQPRITLFGAVSIGLASHTVRLLDGSAHVLIDGALYTGRDASWGVLDTFKGLDESTADSAPAITLGMIPASDLALSTMTDPTLQGSPVTIMLGVLDPATGLCVGEPYVLLTGEIDVPTVKYAENDRRVEFKATGVAERLFMVEEGRRLSASFHRLVWPNEAGLDKVTGVEITIPWGAAVDSTSVQTRSNLPGYNETTNRT